MKADFRALESKAHSNLLLEASNSGRLTGGGLRGNSTTEQSRFRGEWAKQISAVNGSRVACRGLSEEWGAGGQDLERFGGELWVAG